MTKIKPMYVLFSLLLILGLVVTSCTQAPAPGPTTTVTTTVTATGPATSVPTSGQKYTLTLAWDDVYGPIVHYGLIWRPGGPFQTLLYQNSGGRLQLNIINKMFPSMEMVDALAIGKADLGNVGIPWYDGTYPVWNWGMLPGLFSMDSKVLESEKFALLRDAGLRAVEDKIYRKSGLVNISAVDTASAYAVFSKNKIETLSDLKGLKVRVAGNIFGMSFKAFGATPITMRGGEVVQALQTGVIDAVWTSCDDYPVTLMGIHKLTKNVVILPTGASWPEPLLMNAKKFDSLPPDLQKALLQTGQEISYMQIPRLTEITDFTQFILADVGMNVNKFKDVDAAVKLSEGVQNDWLKLTGSDGQEVLNTVKQVIDQSHKFPTKPN